MSVLGSVGGAGCHQETSQAPSYYLLRWVDRVLPPPLLTHLWWVAGEAVAAASAQALVVTLRAHQVLLSPADGGSRSGEGVEEAVSASAGKRSGQITAHCSEC